MMENLIKIIESSQVWLFLVIMIVVGAKYKLEWMTSIRSLLAVALGITFCDLAIDGKIQPKDFTLIVSIVMNFYFLVKTRKEKTNEHTEHPKE